MKKILNAQLKSVEMIRGENECDNEVNWSVNNYSVCTWGINTILKWEIIRSRWKRTITILTTSIIITAWTWMLAECLISICTRLAKSPYCTPGSTFILLSQCSWWILVIRVYPLFLFPRWKKDTRETLNSTMNELPFASPEPGWCPLSPLPYLSSNRPFDRSPGNLSGSSGRFFFVNQFWGLSVKGRRGRE